MIVELKRLMERVSRYLLVSLLVLIPAAAAAQTLEFNFEDPVQLAATETPGDWYPDRFAPCGFVSPAIAPDHSVYTLEESICASDHQPYPADSFYNTQGRKYDLIANTYSVSISLYVPKSWGTTNGRMAGFWATAFDSSNVVGDYPIIEFQGPITSDAGGPGYDPNGGVAGFYGWDNTVGAFTLIGLPPGFKYNSWVELTMTLMPGKGFVYTVTSLNHKKGLSLKTGFSDLTDATLGNVILQGYNYDTSYNIYWNDLNFSFNSLFCK